MKRFSFIYLIIGVLSLIQYPKLFAQKFADKDYYLVDSLNLEELSEADNEILEASLKNYHQSKSDSAKIFSLNNICDSLLHNHWKKYQFLQRNLIEEFEKSDEEVQDGMDIDLCSIEGKTLKYAGAHNPLWIIRDGEIIEIKANKQPIGKYDKLEPYTTHTFELKKDDTIYIFSDGYVDQFGGVKGKKFKTKSFRELLLSIQNKSMNEQRNTINETFEQWRGELEQIDDVCIIGVKHI